MADQRNIYWDSCVFLSYVNGIEDRMRMLEGLLARSSGGDITIYTSVLSRVEVSFGAEEQRRHRLDSEVEGLINSLWSDPATITVVDYHDAIGAMATRLIRDSIPREWSLKPPDAIHLATAQWLSNSGIRIGEFHTYDRRIMRYSSIVGFDICEPYTPQPNLF